MFLNPYRFQQAVLTQASDSYFKNVVLFVDGEGVTGANTVQDQSLHQLTPTALASTVLISSADHRYGTKCLSVPAGGLIDFNTTNDHQALSMGTNNFTLEGSFSIADLSSSFWMFNLCSSEATGRFLFFVDSATRKLMINRANANSVAFGNTTINTGQWYDFAFVRVGGTFSAYLNGVLVGSVSSDNLGSFAGVTVGNGTGGLLIGAVRTAGGGYTAASAGAWKLAHLRITRGIARVIAPFSAPLPVGYFPFALNMQGEAANGTNQFVDEGAADEPGRAVAFSGAVSNDSSAAYYGRSGFLTVGTSTPQINITPVNQFQVDRMDFTMELQVVGGALPTTNYSFMSTWKDTPLSGWRVFMNGSREVTMQAVLSDGTIWATVALRTMPLHFWNAIVVCRRGSVIWISCNGVPVAVGYIGTARIKDAVGPLYVGAEQSAFWNMYGYMDDVTLQVGTGNYSYNWQAAPTAPWPTTAAADRYWNDVVTLIASSLIDQSSKAHPVTNSGIVQSSEYTVFGQQMLKVTTGNYATLTNPNNDWAIGTRDFTVEFDYVCQNTLPDNIAVLHSRSAFTNAGWGVEAYPGLLAFNLAYNTVLLSMTVPQNTLVHITFMRKGDKLLGFINHQLQASIVTSGVVNVTDNANMLIGKLAWQPARGNFHVANIRITNDRLRVWPVQQHAARNHPLGRRYARWDRWDYGTASAAFSSADLGFNGYGAVRANVGLSSGKWYWEVSSNGSIFPVVGVGTADAAVEGVGFYPGQDAQGWSYFGASAKKITGAVQTDYGFVWNNAAHVIGVYLDMDAGTLGFIKNGIDMGIAFTGLQGKTVYPMVGSPSSANSANTTANFGQSAFAGTPPAGYNLGVYRDEVTDVPGYSAMSTDEYQVTFRMTGEEAYGRADGIALDTGIYSFRQVTVGTNASYVGDVVKSGGTSLRVGNTGTSPSWPSHAAFAMNIPRWTWRGWFYMLSDSQSGLLCRRTAGSSAAGWAFQADGVRAKVNGVWSDTVLAWAGSAPAKSVWFHYEVVRDGTALMVFINGVKVAQRDDITSWDDLAQQVILGMSMDNGEGRFNGYVNDVEFWSGVALHGSYSAPPSAEFSVNDANYASVSLQLNFNGANGSTVITDSSPAPKVVTAQGTGKLTTAWSQYGGAAALFDGAGYFTTPTTAAFDLLTGYGCLEMTIYITSDAPVDGDGLRKMGLMTANLGAVATSCWSFVLLGDANVTGTGLDMVMFDAAGAAKRVTAVYGFAKNTLYQVVVERSPVGVNFYVNGSRLSKSVDTIGLTAHSGVGTANPVQIGHNAAASWPWFFRGYMDEIRLTKGVYRYELGFTPTTRPATPIPDFRTLQLGGPYVKLKYWWDASDRSTIGESGSKVTSWTDKVAGVVFSQANAANQPSRNVALMPGRSCVDWGTTGSAIYLKNASGITLRRINTVFIVGYLNNRAPNYSGMGFYNLETTTAARSGGNYKDIESSVSGVAAISDVAGAVSYSSNYALPRSAAFIAEFITEMTPALSNATLNGVGNKSGNTIGAFPDAVSYIVMGSMDAQYVPNGAFAEILMFEGELSPKDRTTIRNALAIKWLKRYLDAYWDKVAISIPGTGANAGVAFTDVSLNAAVITRVGTVITTSTDRGRYDYSCIKVAANTGGRLQVPNAAKYRGTAQPWTLEIAVFCTVYNENKVLFDANNDSSNTTGFQWYIGNDGRMYVWQGTTASNMGNGASTPLTANTWQRLALTWDGTSLRFFREGNLEGTVSAGFQNVWSTAAGFSWLGDKWSTGQQSLNGYAADLRFTPGVCRYTQSYTPTDPGFPTAKD